MLQGRDGSRVSCHIWRALAACVLIAGCGGTGALSQPVATSAGSQTAPGGSALAAGLPAHGQGPRAQDRLHPRAVRRRLGERRRLRHARPDPHPRPARQDLPGGDQPLRRAQRPPRRPLHLDDHRLRPRRPRRRRHRPRRRAQRRVAEGRPALAGPRARRLRQRSAEPAGRRRVRQSPEGRRRHRHLAAGRTRRFAAPTSPARSRSSSSTPSRSRRPSATRCSASWARARRSA